MMTVTRIRELFSSRAVQAIACGGAGVLVGLLALFAYHLRAHTLVTDDPAACMSCHVMEPYYATWSHSSHSQRATCNDCHIPHENPIRKWAFKAKDGMRHVYVFLTRTEPQVIQAHHAGSQVIMNNCIRCHSQLNQEYVTTGRIGYMMAQVGEGKACWDCHRNVPHGGQNALGATPSAIVPHPPAAPPEWLRRMIR